MTKLSSVLKQYCRNESGATSIEYGLIIALIGIAIVAGAKSLGNNLNEGFVTVEAQFPD